MLTVVPVIINTVAPGAGDVIVEVGGVMSGFPKVFLGVLGLPMHPE